MSHVIHQEVDLNASPQRVYNALTKADQFSAFTGYPAEIEHAPGGSFKCFGGQVEGRFVDEVPNERIVQGWRVNKWAEGAYSIVKFELKKNNAGTRLTLDHTGFPEEFFEDLNAGWPKMYFEPLKIYLEKPI